MVDFDGLDEQEPTKEWLRRASGEPAPRDGAARAGTVATLTSPPPPPTSPPLTSPPPLRIPAAQIIDLDIDALEDATLARSGLRVTADRHELDLGEEVLSIHDVHDRGIVNSPDHTTVHAADSFDDIWLRAAGLQAFAPPQAQPHNVEKAPRCARGTPASTFRDPSKTTVSSIERGDPLCVWQWRNSMARNQTVEQMLEALEGLSPTVLAQPAPAPSAAGPANLVEDDVINLLEDDVLDADDLIDLEAEDMIDFPIELDLEDLEFERSPEFAPPRLAAPEPITPVRDAEPRKARPLSRFWIANGIAGGALVSTLVGFAASGSDSEPSAEVGRGTLTVPARTPTPAIKAAALPGPRPAPAPTRQSPAAPLPVIVIPVDTRPQRTKAPSAKPAKRTAPRPLPTEPPPPSPESIQEATPEPSPDTGPIAAPATAAPTPLDQPLDQPIDKPIDQPIDQAIDEAPQAAPDESLDQIP